MFDIAYKAVPFLLNSRFLPLRPVHFRVVALAAHLRAQICRDPHRNRGNVLGSFTAADQSIDVILPGNSSSFRHEVLSKLLPHCHNISASIVGAKARKLWSMQVAFTTFSATSGETHSTRRVVARVWAHDVTAQGEGFVCQKHMRHRAKMFCPWEDGVIRDTQCVLP
ncbi:unnamed protein product [Gadus morhua 'NCC']